MYFPQSEEVLSKYWKEKEESGIIILAADESLTAAEHEKQGEIHIIYRIIDQKTQFLLYFTHPHAILIGLHLKLQKAYPSYKHVIHITAQNRP